MKSEVLVEDEGDLDEGAVVTVGVGGVDEPVLVTDEVLVLIREGQAAAACGKLLDARQFLRELRCED